MVFKLGSTILFLSLLRFISSQQVYIDSVPEYHALDSCAVAPLSTVVRDMYSGCGDGGRTTSYSCFCLSSSTHMASVISKAVLSRCANDTSGATSAMEVFHSYCLLGAQITTTPTATNASASIATSATATSPSSSSTESAASSQKNNAMGGSGLSSGARIAIGVVIPIVVIAIGMAIFLLMRRKSQRRRAAAAKRAQMEEVSASQGDGDKTDFEYKAELPATTEMEKPQMQFQELPATTKMEKPQMQVQELPAEERAKRGELAELQ